MKDIDEQTIALTVTMLATIANRLEASGAADGAEIVRGWIDATPAEGPHVHKATAASEPQGFVGAVNESEDAANRKAHGGYTVVEQCACGAKRVVNRNGNHAEYGEWRTRLEQQAVEIQSQVEAAGYAVKVLDSKQSAELAASAFAAQGRAAHTHMAQLAARDRAKQRSE